MSKLDKPLDSWLMNMVTFDYFVTNFNSIITCKNNFFVKNTQLCRPILLFWDWWIWSFSLLKRLNIKNHQVIFFSWIETLKWYDNSVRCMYSVTSKLKNFKFPCPISIALKLYLTLLGNPRRRHVVVCIILEPSEYLKLKKVRSLYMKRGKQRYGYSY